MDYIQDVYIVSDTVTKHSELAERGNNPAFIKVKRIMTFFEYFRYNFCLGIN